MFFVLAYFAGAVPLAVYADDWGDLFGNSPSSLVRRIEPDAGATSVSHSEGVYSSHFCEPYMEGV